MAHTLTEEFVWKEIGGQVVVLQHEQGEYWTLNDTGSFIWKALVDGKSVSAIAALLVDEFGVDAAQSTQDVQQFLDDCVQKRMLMPS